MTNNVRLFMKERFIAFQCLPPEFVLNDAKITFFIIKNDFSALKLYSYLFQPFLLKRKIFKSLTFHDLSFENDCGNPPGQSILLKFSQIVAQR